MGQNEAFDVVFWIDGSHRLRGGDDEFFEHLFVARVKALSMPLGLKLVLKQV